MNESTDSQLLRAYVESRSETAFAELVRRHVDFVYSAALRMVRDPHLAEDVTQGVFVALAKSAAQLTDRAVLSGWLHRTAQNIAAQTVRTIERRRAREQEAAAMNELLVHAPDAPWEDIAPHLDAALGDLTDADRDALLLRYFERKSAQEMAQVLGVSDEAAQKRVSRAVERLREFLAKRGVAIGGQGLVVIIVANAIQAAPVGLTAAISTAVAGMTVATAGTATLVTVSWLNAKSAAAIVSAALITGTVIYLAQQHRLERAESAHRELVAKQIELTAERDLVVAVAQASEREVVALRRDLVDLPRLRGEITLLRAQARGGGALAGRIPLVAQINVLHEGVPLPGTNSLPAAHDEQLRAAISVKTGDPFNRIAIDQDVRALFETGFFANIRVVDQKTNDDYILDYRVVDKPQPGMAGKYLSGDQITFAGYETPEATLQSAIWSARSGNYAAFTNSIDRARSEKFPSPEEFEAALRNSVENSVPTGFQILARKSRNESFADLKTRSDFGLSGKSQMDVFTFVRNGHEWKFILSGGPDISWWENSGGIQYYTP